MRADNSIHLVAAARRRHELTRAKAIAAMHELDRAGAVLTFESVARHAASPAPGSTPSPTSKTRSTDCGYRIAARPRRYPPRSAPATNRCGGASKSRTAATANSLTKTNDYADNSPTCSVNSATTDEPTRRTAISRTSQLGNNQPRADDKPTSHAAT